MSGPVMSLQTVGNWSDKIQIPLANALSAATEICGWSGYKACEKAIVYMAKSAGKLTKVSAKLRPIVANPLFSTKVGKALKNDMRRARYGVYKWNPKTGERYFSPIYRCGEFGAAVKYISKKEVLVKVGRKSSKSIRLANKALRLIGSRKRFGSVGIWQKFPAGTGEFEVAGIKQSKKRIIGRRGLAKDSWMWGIKGFHPKAIPNVTDVQPIISAIQCGLVLTDRVRYLSKITPANLVEEVTRKATDSIMFTAAQALERKLGVEVPRLARTRRGKEAIKRLEQEFGKAEKAGII